MTEYARKELPEGKIATVDPLTFGRARINVSPDAEAQWYDDNW